MKLKLPFTKRKKLRTLADRQERGDSHRCANCWWAGVKAEALLNPEAGFSPSSQPYPHAIWCVNRNLF